MLSSCYRIVLAVPNGAVVFLVMDDARFGVVSVFCCWFLFIVLEGVRL